MRNYTRRSSANNMTTNNNTTAVMQGDTVGAYSYINIGCEVYREHVAVIDRAANLYGMTRAQYMRHVLIPHASEDTGIKVDMSGYGGSDPVQAAAKVKGMTKQQYIEWSSMEMARMMLEKAREESRTVESKKPQHPAKDTGASGERRKAG
jgi:hypothetical protein